jgi:TIM-barrel protein
VRVVYIKVLAPMAGITDGTFCCKLIPYGFDMVTLGGYNADKPAIIAGKKILERGRPEFDIAEDDLFQIIKYHSNLIKSHALRENRDVQVSVNLRSLDPDPIIQISKISELDVVEINAHCRQKELIDIGCGQAFLQNINFLEDFAREVVKKSSAKVSVKIRANVNGVDELEIAQIIEDSGCDFIHVDAMKPGINQADLDIITSISNQVETFLIGNNSIKDVKSAKKMFEAGAQGISIARAAISGKINFDLAKI